jgi:hypothetical protein
MHLAVFVDWVSCEQPDATEGWVDVRSSDKVRISIRECDDIEDLLR